MTKHNLLNGSEMFSRGLLENLTELDRPRNVHVIDVLLQSRGTNTFCAGGNTRFILDKTYMYMQ